MGHRHAGDRPDLGLAREEIARSEHQPGFELGIAILQRLLPPAGLADRRLRRFHGSFDDSEGKVGQHEGPGAVGHAFSRSYERAMARDPRPPHANGAVHGINDPERRTKALLELNDRFREHDDPVEIAYAAAEILGRTLNVSRAGYGLIDPVAETITIERDWNAPGIQSLAGVLHFRDYGSYIEDLKQGRTVVFADAEKDARTADTADALKAISAQSVVNMPVNEQGGFVALLYLNHEIAREWSTDELEFIRDVAERTRAVSERRRVELELKRSAERFETVFENAAVGMIEIDADWRILGANAGYCDAVGIQRTALVGQNCLAFTHPDDVETSQRALRKAAAGRKGERISFEKRYIRADGSEIWIRSNLAKVSGHGATARFLKIVEDITQAKAMQRALEDNQSTLETLNRTGAALAAELDTEKVVQLVTDAGVDLTGAAFGAFFYNVIDEQGEALLLYTLSGAKRSDFEQFGHPRATAVFAPTFKGEGVVRSDDITADPRYGQNPPNKGMPENHLPVRSYLAVPVVSRSGEVIGGLFFGHPDAGVFTDATERLMVGLAGQAAVALDNARLFEAAQRDNQTLEERVEQRTKELEEANEALRQAQKMEAVGQLTGGIAHDFNNLLAGITGSLDVIERRIARGKTEGIDRFIAGAQTSAQRAAALTQRLLAFSRRQTLDPKPTDANRLVLGLEDLIHRTVGPAIKVEVVGAAGLWSTMIDQVQLESALINLAINARDAMPDGGRLIIETANKWLDERASKERDLPPGQYISICVTDTGTGIPKDITDRIFDPFFTTKPIGQGTGLGLSMIHGFVRQSGGQIRVYSEAGQGTTMCLYLPRYIGEVSDEEHHQDTEIADMGAGEAVLVIDDEPIVRMLIVDVLEEAGYTALEADDGPSGLQIMQSTPNIALLITDVGLPGGMNGRQVADAARELQPKLKVLFVTGYAENAAISGGHLEPGMAVMTKPFVMTDLAHKITELIEL
jgi:PAS domain S-box-containing protein